MDIYDQHEQSERVRSWLKDNGGAIITGVVIGLGAIFGYQQWQSYKMRQAYTAAELYNRTHAGESAAQPTAEPQNTPEVDAARSQLRSDYAGSGFAVLAALEQAHAHVGADDIDGARASLAWAREHAEEPALKNLVGLRLARLEFGAGRADEALKVLATLSGDDYASARAELRGDAHAALGQLEQARTAYEEARAAGSSDPARLDMKLGEYAAAQPQVAGEGA